MKMRALLLAIALAVLGISGANAQFPDRPIRLVSGFAPGGVTDAVARILAEGLQKRYGQTVIVENKVGASGLISTREVARATPDGYTLLVGGFGAQLIPPLLMENYTVDVVNELTPIAGVADFMNIIAVSSALPVNSIPELVKYAKENPGKLRFGSAGVGASNYLSAVLFMQKTGIDMLHVPSKGGFGPLTDLLSGTVDVIFENIPIISSFDKSSQVRMLAVTGDRRSDKFPNLPTVVESGIPDYVLKSWISVFGPAEMPEPLLKQVNHSIIQVLKEATVQEKLEGLGFQPMLLNQGEFKKFFLAERAFWKKIIDKAGIKIGK